MLGVGLQSAKSGLAVVAEQIGLVSRNVAQSGDPNATRRIARVVTTGDGGAVVARIDRAESRELFDLAVSASTLATGSRVTIDRLNRLQSVIGDPAEQRSPAAMLGFLRTALATYAANPADEQRGRAVVSAAQGVAHGLNEASQAVHTARTSADEEIVASVALMNDLLGKFGVVNRQIIAGTRNGSDITNAQDQRDAIVTALSQEIGLRIVARSDGDWALYSDSGITMFESTARTIEFDPAPLSPGTKGGVVRIDGVPAAGPGETMSIVGGRLRALVDFRDLTADTFQAQLDEIARGLIEVFAESPQTPHATLPLRPGLFTASGVSSVPVAGARVIGLGSLITTNAAFDPSAGGNVALIRDGGANGAAYSVNGSASTGFADRIDALTNALSQTRSFSIDAALGPATSLLDFAAGSVSWLSQARQVASTNDDYRSAMHAHAAEALGAETGISLDQEMAHMLELERSFQATSRIIATIDEMLKVLMNTVG